MSQGPLMVLDSAGLWFRAFHSVPEKITGPDGAPANALRGFCDMVAVLVEEYSPTGLVAALDREWRPTWRVELLPSYKAHRVGDDGEGVAVVLDHLLRATTARRTPPKRWRRR